MTHERPADRLRTSNTPGTLPEGATTGQAPSGREKLRALRGAQMARAAAHKWAKGPRQSVPDAHKPLCHPMPSHRPPPMGNGVRQEATGGRLPLSLSVSLSPFFPSLSPASQRARPRPITD